MPAPRELLIKVVLPCVLSPSSFTFVAFVWSNVGLGVADFLKFATSVLGLVVTALSVSTGVDAVVGLQDCGYFAFDGFFLGFLPFVVAECVFANINLYIFLIA